MLTEIPDEMKTRQKGLHKQLPSEVIIASADFEMQKNITELFFTAVFLNKNTFSRVSFFVKLFFSVFLWF